MSNLAKNLKEIRKKNNLSQEAFAEELGVSRQSVSKWESSQAYPEMEKIIQISKKYDVSVDDLIHENINEVIKNGKSENKIKHYIDSITNFTTDSINMFSKMEFRSKLSCFFEHGLISIILLILYLLSDSIIHHIFYLLLSFIPYNILIHVVEVISCIYLILFILFSLIILLNNFKQRYLNYFIDIFDEDINNDLKTNNSEKNDGLNKLIDKEKNKGKKIIIRSEKREYGFFNLLYKFIIICLKLFICFIGVIFCLSLVCISFSLVLSLSVIKSGFLFIGLLISILSCLAINIDILLVIFNFIFNRRNNKKFIIYSLIISVMLFGIGIGISFLSITDFKKVSINDNKYYKKEEIKFVMSDNIRMVDEGNNIKYVVDDRDDIRVVLKSSKYYKVNYMAHDNRYYFYLDTINNDILDILRSEVNSINNKKIIDYSKYQIIVYTNSNNIRKISSN